MQSVMGMMPGSRVFGSLGHAGCVGVSQNCVRVAPSPREVRGLGVGCSEYPAPPGPKRLEGTTELWYGAVAVAGCSEMVANLDS